MDIFLIAYINKNFGDDMFVDLICRRYPQHVFHVLGSPLMTDYLSEIPNLRVHSYNRVTRSVNARIANYFGKNYLMEQLARRYRYCVCIGGSIFIQAPDWRKVAKEREKVRKKTLEYYIVSANFGPYENQEYAEYYNNWFARLKDVCFRDEYSYNLFHNMKQVRYEPDAIFGYLNEEPKRIAHPKKTLVISAIDYTWRRKEKVTEYEGKLAQIGLKFLSDGWKVVLLALCGQEGDNCAVERVYKAVNCENPNEDVEQYFYDGNYKEVCNILRKSDFVISSRFHATVIPLSIGVPVLPVPYSDKTRAMLNDIGYDGPIWELDQGGISDGELEKAMNYHFEPKCVVQRAGEQFEAVDQLLNE